MDASSLLEIARWTNAWGASDEQVQQITDRLVSTGRLRAVDVTGATDDELAPGRFADHVHARRWAR